MAEINRIQLLRGCFIYTVYKLLKLLHKMIHCKALLCSVAYYIFCHKLFNVYLMFSVYNDQPCSILCKNKKKQVMLKSFLVRSARFVQSNRCKDILPYFAFYRGIQNPFCPQLYLNLNWICTGTKYRSCFGYKNDSCYPSVCICDTASFCLHGLPVLNIFIGKGKKYRVSIR